MSKVVEIQRADDPRDVIHQAVQLLAEGQLVAFPTETVYVVAAHSLKPEAVARLRGLSEMHAQAQHVLALKGPAEALDYVPDMSHVGLKFVRRCWPGPVTLVFEVGADTGLASALPAETRQAVAAGGELNLRVPAHDIVLDVLRLMPAPLVLSCERLPEAAPHTTAAEIMAAYQEKVALVIDDGPSRYGQPSSVVQIQGEAWKLIREGVVTERILGRLASEVYLFVCTGNTCRSPMAEGLFRKLLSEKLGCTEEFLVDRGFVVASAGLSAALGGPPSPEAVKILGLRDIDLRGHESQPLTPRLLNQADHVFAMTRNHRDTILWEYPELSDRVHLLSREGTDISDPIGGGPDDYARCAEEIEQHLRAILSDLEVEKS
jgi:protein-tyrosine phosphatase